MIAKDDLASSAISNSFSVFSLSMQTKPRFLNFSKFKTCKNRCLHEKSLSNYVTPLANPETLKGVAMEKRFRSPKRPVNIPYL